MRASASPDSPHPWSRASIPQRPRFPRFLSFLTNSGYTGGFTGQLSHNIRPPTTTSSAKPTVWYASEPVTESTSPETQLGVFGPAALKGMLSPISPFHNYLTVQFPGTRVWLLSAVESEESKQ